MLPQIPLKIVSPSCHCFLNATISLKSWKNNKPLATLMVGLPPPPFMGLPCTRVFHKMGLHTGKITTFSKAWMTFKPHRYNSNMQIHCTHKRIVTQLSTHCKALKTANETSIQHSVETESVHSALLQSPMSQSASTWNWTGANCQTAVGRLRLNQ